MKKYVNFIIALESYTDTCWQNDFYPSDLPKDWFLDYYSKLESLLAEIDDGFCEGFSLFLPSTAQQNVEQLVAGIDFTSQDDLKIDFYMPFEALADYEGGWYSICHHNLLIKIDCKIQMQPKELKQLLDACLRVDESLYNNDIYVFFTDSKHAISNVSNFNLLTQLI